MFAGTLAGDILLLVRHSQKIKTLSEYFTDFDQNFGKERWNPTVKLDKFICIQMPCHTSWALFKSCGISNKFNLLLKARCGVFITAHEPAFSVENSNESKAKNVGSCKFKSCDGGATQ